MGPQPCGENQITIHGTLVRIGTEGILLRGEPGVGKSTTALEFMAGGGQLVADDIVAIKRIGNELYGTAPPVLKGILAIPELGIFDVREVIGTKYFTPSTRITRCIDIGWLDETDGRGFDAEFHGLNLPRTYRKVERSHKSAIFPLEINLPSLKKSETKFFQGHGRVVASPSAP